MALIPQSLMGEGSSGEWSPGEIPYQALAMATNNFSEERVLGMGGFGPVYRGFLSDWGWEVAVKKLRHMSHLGMKQYASEVKIITQVSHPNLVRLLGWCEDQRDLMLVYEFMPHGSLDAHLFYGRSLLTWSVRYKIVLGLARALIYLHDECKPSVLHRDVKSSNVLLDSNFDAKLADFGLAMLFYHDMSSTQVSHAAGTRGYWAPEYALAAKASKRSDVYSFGVVILEIACGQKTIRTVMAAGEDGESGPMLLVEWVWDLYGKGTILAAVDQRLNSDFVRQEVELLLKVGLWCAHPDHQQRPSMRQAMDALLHPETARAPDLPAKMPPWAYMAAPVQMRMVQVASSSPPPPVSRSSPRHGSSPSPSRHGERAVDSPEHSSDTSSTSRSHREPKRSIFGWFAWWKRPMKSSNGGEIRAENRVAEITEFALRDLLRATNQFADENKVREDEFSVVYRGKLASGVDVDVKRFLAMGSWGNDVGQMASDYIAVLGGLSHENLLKPVGQCFRRGGEHLLVFEAMANGSLDRHLHYSYPGSREMRWEARYNVALGLASALHYLHDGSEKCVLHRDIKTKNVLLDEEFNAKLDGFELPWLTDHDVSGLETRLAGTMGYLAPELMVTGKFTRATDVYSFGIVALEIACGRKPIDGRFSEEPESILHWVWKHHGDGVLLDAADLKLMDRFDRGQMERLLAVGLWCSLHDPAQRPPMARVLRVLRSEEDPPVFSRSDHGISPSITDQDDDFGDQDDDIQQPAGGSITTTASPSSDAGGPEHSGWGITATPASSSHPEAAGTRVLFAHRDAGIAALADWSWTAPSAADAEQDGVFVRI